MSKSTAPFRRLALAAALAMGLTACKPPPSADAELNRAESAKFLSENRQKPGIQATPSGLQYQVLKEGTGASPKATDVVTVNYKGSLANGQPFDNGEGIRFPLNGVIPGWTEGLQLMKEGATYRFFIPPELAYGESGAGRVIPPNAALIFEVDLLKVEGS
jgi:FKBP-type peptidyl-prolyl cis-trans isomerase